MELSCQIVEENKEEDNQSIKSLASLYYFRGELDPEDQKPTQTTAFAGLVLNQWVAPQRKEVSFKQYDISIVKQEEKESENTE